MKNLALSSKLRPTEGGGRSIQIIYNDSLFALGTL